MTCILETFSTLRIFSDTIQPDVIGEKLGIKATGGYVRNPDARSKSKRETNYYSWSTDRHVDPFDNLSHIKRIIGKFNNKALELEELRRSGCETDICNYLVTTGHGGPELDIETMQSLCRLGLTIWWDVYKGGEDKT